MKFIIYGQILDSQLNFREPKKIAINITYHGLKILENQKNCHLKIKIKINHDC